MTTENGTTIGKFVKRKEEVAWEPENFKIFQAASYSSSKTISQFSWKLGDNYIEFQLANRIENANSGDWKNKITIHLKCEELLGIANFILFSKTDEDFKLFHDPNKGRDFNGVSKSKIFYMKRYNNAIMGNLKEVIKENGETKTDTRNFVLKIDDITKTMVILSHYFKQEFEFKLNSEVIPFLTTLKGYYS